VEGGLKRQYPTRDVTHVACRYITAVLAPSIETVFSINGVLMGLTISFYLPAAMWVMMIHYWTGVF
jgi:hypothetical protein